MKRTVLIILLLPIVLSAFMSKVNAIRFDFDGYSGGSELPAPDLSGIADELPEEGERELSAYFDAGDDDERREAVTERLDPRYWAEYILKLFKNEFLTGADLLSSVLGLLILSSVFASVRDGEDPLKKGFAVDLTSLFLALEIARTASSAASDVSGYLFRISSIMTSMNPVMNALYISSGRVTEMTVNSSALMLFVTVASNFNAYVLAPLASCTLALTTVSGIMPGSSVHSFAETVKKALIGVISFFTAIFSFVMGVQSSLAAGADSLAARTVKFAVEGSVPIVGGAASEAVTTVGASLSLIKKTTGGAGIVLILLILVPTLVRLASLGLSLTVCKGAADLSGNETASNVISGARSVMAVFAAAAVSVGILFILAVTLFMNSGTSGA